jgi:hypothetical protein
LQVAIDFFKAHPRLTLFAKMLAAWFIDSVAVLLLEAMLLWFVDGPTFLAMFYDWFDGLDHVWVLALVFSVIYEIVIQRVVASRLTLGMQAMGIRHRRLISNTTQLASPGQVCFLLLPV